MQPHSKVRARDGALPGIFRCQLPDGAAEGRTLIEESYGAEVHSAARLGEDRVEHHANEANRWPLSGGRQGANDEQ